MRELQALIPADMHSSPVRQFITLVVLALAATLAPVSIDILAPSLPGISAGLGANPQTIELTIYSFLIGYGISPSFWGPLSDRLGRRPIMFVGMLIYTVSSLAAASADEASWLITVRFLQGIGGGAGATMARAIIRDIYGAAGTTRGMARMISLMSILPFLMPLLGGVVADQFSWSACFIVMALIAVISVTAYFFLVPESAPRKLLPQAQRPGSVIGIMKNPIFAQHALCNMFSISTLVLFGANFAFITQHEFSFDSADNGLVLALFNGALSAGTYLVWWLMRKFNTHQAILMGAGSCTLGWLGIALLANSGLATVAAITPLLGLAAAGSGVIMALCSGTALAPFSHNSGTASSLYLLLQSAGSSAISLCVGLLLPKQLLPIAAAICCCGCLAILSKLAFPRSTVSPDKG
jgi:DHA1 family bicyclomycin/chloramphenicol resistance-like MFS transporter